MTFLKPSELRSTLNISRSTEHRLLKHGLPCLGAGRLRRYDERATVEWFGAHARRTNPTVSVLEPGAYRCTCGFEGTLHIAIALTQRGPCPQCGSRDIPVRVNDHSSADTPQEV